jgi:hypothetical protein
VSKIVEVVSRGGAWSPRLTSADPLAPSAEADSADPEALTHRRKVSVSINQFPTTHNFRPVALGPDLRSRLQLVCTSCATYTLFTVQILKGTNSKTEQVRCLDSDSLIVPAIRRRLIPTVGVCTLLSSWLSYATRKISISWSISKQLYGMA